MMDVKTQAETEEKSKGGLFGYVERQMESRRSDKDALLCDTLTFVVAVLFARCHLAFGTYPLALGYVACLPRRVWIALAGAVIGALTMGSGGIVYALLCVITVFLRIVISGGEDVKSGGVSKKSGIFDENLWLRMSSAVIGGFIGGAYELLLHGLTLAGALYALTMVLACGASCLLFGGLFSAGIGADSFLFGDLTLRLPERAHSKEKLSLIYFQISLAAYVFFLPLALRDVRLFGIGIARVLVGCATLFVARRFGTLRAMATGFIGALGISSSAAVAFALAGGASGILFGFGIGYGLLGFVATVGAWSAYSTGLGGLLSLLPEAAIATVIGFPIYRKVRIKSDAPRPTAETRASDMVGTMTLSYRAGCDRALGGLEESMSAIAPLLRKLNEHDNRATREEYVAICRAAMDTCCKTCHLFGACEQEGEDAQLSRVLDKLCRGEPIAITDLGLCGGEASDREHMIEAIRREAARLEEEKYRRGRAGESADMFELFAKLLNEARLADEASRAVDDVLSKKVEALLPDAGLSHGVARVLGDRRRHILVAGEDADGDKITSPELHRAIEEACRIRLGTPNYFRKERFVLMEAQAAPRYRVESAVAALARAGSEITGDSVRCCDGRDGCFYAVLSDGMGSGEQAHTISEFAVEFLTRSLGFGCNKGTVLYLLNRIVRRRGEECCATVDLFSFDLVNATAQFHKSGAAPSYLKRGDSIFRIRSQTVPIGLLQTLDTERIKVEVSADDLIIMLSDGVSQSPEDAPWLLELLSKPAPRDLKTYAEQILAMAERHNRRRDDMTVVVARIAVI